MNNTVRKLPITVTILFLLLWARYPIFEFIIGACYHVPLLKEFSPQIPDILIVTFAILSLPYIVKRLRIQDVLFYVAIVVFYFISKYNHPGNFEALDYYTVPFLVVGLPYFFVGVTIDLKSLWRYLYYVSFASIIFKGVHTFMLGGVEVLESESMTAAYSILPHLLLVIWYTISQRKPWDLFAVVVGILLLFAFGNRGTLMISAIFASFCVIGVINQSKKKRGGYITIAVLAVLVVFFASSGIIDSIFSFLSSTGSSTRIFEKSQTDGFFLSEGRMDIFYLVIPAILQNPFGLGIAGDRLLGVIYSHNIILEFLISFGWFFGTLLILCVVIMFIKALKRAPTIEHKIFLLLLLSSGVFKLMLSNTYLNDTFFYFMLGFCVAILRLPKQSSINKEINTDENNH